MSDPSLLNWTYLVLLEDPWLNFCTTHCGISNFCFKNIAKTTWKGMFHNYSQKHLNFRAQNTFHFWGLNQEIFASMCKGTEKTIWHATTIILTLNQISEVKTSWHFAPKKKYFATLTTMAEKNLSSLGRFEFISSLLSLILTLMMKSSRLLWNANWQTSELYCPLRPFYSFGFWRGEVRITFCNL